MKKILRSETSLQTLIKRKCYKGWVKRKSFTENIALLFKVFRKNDPNAKIKAHYDDVSISADLFLMPDTRSDFSKVLETLVKQVLNEDRLVPEGMKRESQ